MKKTIDQNQKSRSGEGFFEQWFDPESTDYLTMGFLYWFF